jgi:ketosteroid isomerase-like protein
MRYAEYKSEGDDEAALRQLIAQWAKAVRDEDLPGIRANHDPDILMFDVPPPFLSRDLDAYMTTWQIFYPSQARPITFDFEEVEVTAGSDVPLQRLSGIAVTIEGFPSFSLGDQLR